MLNIYDLTYEMLEENFEEAGIKKFRAKQVFNWLYKSLAEEFDHMNNLDAKTLEYLKENFYIPSLVLKTKQASSSSQKALFKLNDGNVVESVLMHFTYGNSVCVTTQVGCKIGCSFCASGLGGFIRNLSSGEIIMQVLHFARILRQNDETSRVSNIVVMGIGEPLDNLKNVLQFIDVVNDDKGLGIGARHITVSTSGIVPKIYEIADYPRQISLALSLHAPNDKLRSQIMKINNTYNINELMEAIDFYIEKTNRRVSMEYILLSKVNDKVEHARELAKLLRGKNVHVNLIRYNIVKEFDYNSPIEADVQAFKDELMKNKILVTVRQSLGNNIDGACGQLRLNNG